MERKDIFDKDGWIVNLSRYDLDEVNLATWQELSKELNVPIIVSKQDEEDKVELCKLYNLPSYDWVYYYDGFALGFFVDNPYGEEFKSYKARLFRYVKFLNQVGIISDHPVLHDISLNFLPAHSR